MEKQKASGDNHEPLKIMIIDNNITCLQIVSKLFSRREFQVLPFLNAAEALYALRESKDEELVDLILIEIHVGSTKFTSLTGPKFLEHVKKEKKNLPIFTMCAHNDEEEVSDDQFSRRDFFHITKPITDQSIETLRKKAMQKKAKKVARTQIPESSKRSRKGRNNDKVKIINSLAISHEIESSDELESEGENGGRRKKRGRRLIWNLDLHNRFLIALNLLGEYACPQRITEIMNVDGLSTKHVASHLQKHKLRVERLTKKADMSNKNMVPPERSNSLPIEAATLNADKIPSVVKSPLASINQLLKLNISEFTHSNYLKDHFGYFNKSNNQLMIMNEIPSSSDDGSWGLIWKRVDEPGIMVSKEDQDETGIRTEIMVSKEVQHETEITVSKEVQRETEIRVGGEQIIMQNAMDNDDDDDEDKDAIIAMDNLYNEIDNIDINILLQGIGEGFVFNYEELCMPDDGNDGENLWGKVFPDHHTGESSGNTLPKIQEFDNSNGSMVNKAGEKRMVMDDEISLMDYQL